ncbi:hypothetical protein P9911_029510 [Klebsiella oxytoca]|nr:hypothetical protein [Klebsiella oxytoca]MEC5509943.1 hypothetical protein [Klebsiella oxytoca]
MAEQKKNAQILNGINDDNRNPACALPNISSSMPSLAEDALKPSGA